MATHVEAEAPATPVEVRARLTEALELDLVGPSPGHPLAEERLHPRERPSNWYLTGFLIPKDAPEEQQADDDADDELQEVPESEGLTEESAEERTTAKKGFFPSSMGLSTLVASDAQHLRVTVRWGDYDLIDHEREEAEADESENDKGGEGGEGGAQEREDRGRLNRVWKRTPRQQDVDVPLGDGLQSPRTLEVPDSGGLELHVLEREVSAASLDGRIPDGTRSVSLFLVNARRPDPDERDRAYVFQTEFDVACEQPFVPRPDLRGAFAEEWDELVADLHYADTPEYATGHGVSADWELEEGDCRLLRTRWLPAAAVERTEAAPIDGVELGMNDLGVLGDGATARAALAPLVQGYRAWLAEQQEVAERLDGKWRDTGRARAPRRPRRQADRAGHRGAGRRPGRARRVPRGEPRRGRRAAAAS